MKIDYLLTLAATATVLSCDKQPATEILPGEGPGFELISEKGLLEYLDFRYSNMIAAQDAFKIEENVNAKGEMSDEDRIMEAFNGFVGKVTEEMSGGIPPDNEGEGGAFALEDASLVSAKVSYWSVDGNGKPIKLSGNIYFPVVKNSWGKNVCPDGGLTGILINCFPTMPQGSLIETFKALSNTCSASHHAFKNMLVIEPEYIGFGESADRIQTYMCQRLIARNCADMILPAIEAMQNAKGFLRISYGMKFNEKDFEGSYIMGYSQGGGNALALARYLTVEDKTGLKDKIKLKHVLCADGPYDPMVTFSTWLDRKSMKLSVLIPMVIAGFKEGHSDILKNINIYDYFTDGYKQSGIIQNILARNMAGFADCLVFDSLHKTEDSEGSPASVKLSEVLTEDTRENPPLWSGRKLIDECLNAEEVHKGWKPDSTFSITLYTLTADDIVPIENTNVAYNSFLEAGAANVRCYRKAGSSHVVEMQTFFNNSFTYGWYKGEGFEGEEFE